MKKVEYGFSNSSDPIGSWEGIGIKNKPEGAVSGEFLGIIKLSGEDYLIGRTTLAFGNNPEYIGKITARRAAARKYKDGSGIIFLDMDESDKTKAIEEVLEEKHATEGSLKSLANNEFDSLVGGEEVIATSVPHDVFERIKMVEAVNSKEEEIKENKTY